MDTSIISDGAMLLRQAARLRVASSGRHDEISLMWISTADSLIRCAVRLDNEAAEREEAKALAIAAEFDLD